MNTITVTDTSLLVEPRGLDKVWSLTGGLEIPLDHVRGATVDPGITKEPKGIRAPGMALPGKWAGTFHRDGERSFWNVDFEGTPIVIELRDEHFTRLVLTADDPRETVDRINAAARGA